MVYSYLSKNNLKKKGIFFVKVGCLKDVKSAIKNSIYYSNILQSESPTLNIFLLQFLSKQIFFFYRIYIKIIYANLEKFQTSNDMSCIFINMNDVV